MSNQYKAGVVTTLEHVFLSREFARTLDRRALFHDRAQGTGLEELEQVPHSDHFGGRRDRSPHVTEAAGTSQAALWPENAVSRVLPSGLRENNRAPRHCRGQRRRGSSAGRRRARLRWCAAAAGERVGSRPAHRLPFGTEGPRRLSGGAVAWPGWRRRDARGVVRLERCATRVPDGTAGAHGDGTADPSGTERTATRRDGRGSARDDRHVGPIARSAPGGAPGAGTGGATSSPSPTPPAPSNPTAPVVVVVGNTVTTVGSAVTTANQVGSGVPTVAPATGALGVGATGALGAVGSVRHTVSPRASIQQRPDNTRQRQRRRRVASAGLMRRAAYRTLFSDFQTTVRRNCRQFSQTWFSRGRGRYMVAVRG